jgi:hypothetical protein
VLQAVALPERLQRRTGAVEDVALQRAIDIAEVEWEAILRVFKIDSVIGERKVSTLGYDSFDRTGAANNIEIIRYLPFSACSSGLQHTRGRQEHAPPSFMIFEFDKTPGLTSFLFFWCIAFLGLVRSSDDSESAFHRVAEYAPTGPDDSLGNFSPLRPIDYYSVPGRSHRSMDERSYLVRNSVGRCLPVRLAMGCTEEASSRDLRKTVRCFVGAARAVESIRRMRVALM